MALSLRQLLTDHRDTIVARFVTQVQRKDLPPPGLSKSLLIDHIPKFLDDIVAELTAVEGVRYSHDAIDKSQTARQARRAAVDARLRSRRGGPRVWRPAPRHRGDREGGGRG